MKVCVIGTIERDDTPNKLSNDWMQKTNNKMERIVHLCNRVASLGML